MKSNKLKLAFLGGGINSAVGMAHYSAISIDNNFELVAGSFSRNNETNQTSASYYKITPSRVYNDVDILINAERNNVDAVVVLTPTNQHAMQVTSLLESKIPVICEKSLATSLDENLRIKELLNKNNGFLAVIYNYLGYPMVRELKYIAQNGLIGTIHHIQIEMPQEGFIREDLNGNPKIPQDWRLNDSEIPTISLDLGVHLHMLIKYLTNEKPLKVVAKCSSSGNFPSVIDNINCLIDYSNNITCNMWYSKIALGKRNGLKISIYASKGSVEWVQENPEILNLSDNQGRRWTLDRGDETVKVCNLSRYSRFKVGHPSGFIEAFANYYQDIYYAVLDYNNKGELNFGNCFGVEESIEGMRLFETIQKSCISNSWEKIDYSKI